jgi:hypothetical protein
MDEKEYKKECKTAIKNIYNCHVHIFNHDSKEFFNCASQDFEKYIFNCKKMYEEEEK